MKRLLVVLLSVLVISVFAANATVSWSGSASFELIIDEKGIDVTHSAYIEVYGAPFWTTVEGTPVTVTFGWSSFSSSQYGTLYSITYDGNLLKLAYSNGGAEIDKYFYEVGSDYVSLTIKALKFLTLYYADIVDETTINSTNVDFADSYFDDFVAAEISYDLGVMDLKAIAAYYDADSTVVSNDYEFGGVVYLTGKDAIEGLSIEAVFASLAEAAGSDTAYGVIVNYSKDFEFEPVTITVEPALHYSENLTKMAYMDADSVSDAKEVSMGLTAEVSVDPVTITLETEPTYKIEDATTTVYLSLGAKAAIDPVNISATFEVPDVLKFNDEWSVSANANVAVAPLGLDANIKYLNTGDFGYNVSATYDIEEGLTAKAFFGTLYDSDGDGSDDINADSAQWYLTLSYSTSF